ncbi:MAG: hypothetical protein PHC83_05125 [Bacteroidales bacterium]|jgi:hypothetical protein|nr:hypothetical protein [Bacteroidales bacterium]
MACTAQNDSMLLHIGERYSVYGIDFPSGIIPPLSLKDSINGFNYIGEIFCNVIVDQKEKCITEVLFYKIILKNDIDSIYIQFPKMMSISEYYGEYRDLIMEIYQYIVPFLKSFRISRKPTGSVMWDNRYMSWIIPIKIE